MAFSPQPVLMEELSETLAIELDDQRGYDPDLKVVCIHWSPITNSSVVTTSMICLGNATSIPGYDDAIWDSFDIVVTKV